MLTEEQLKMIIEEMGRMFGGVPNPEHEPIRFEHYVRLYKYYKRMGVNA